MPFSEHADSEVVRYHHLSVWAVAGLVLGVLGLTALLSPMLWAVPVAGIVASAVGIYLTGRKEVIRGRKIAFLGLFLSVAIFTAAVFDHYRYLWELEHQARQVAAQFFTDLAEGNVREAHQVTVRPLHRSATEDLDDFYKEGTEMADTLALWQSLADPELTDQLPIYPLVQLGKNARVEYMETLGNRVADRGHEVALAYKVTAIEPIDESTLPADEEFRPPFYVGLTLNRYHKKDGRAYWHLTWVRFLEPIEE